MNSLVNSPLWPMEADGLELMGGAQMKSLRAHIIALHGLIFELMLEDLIVRGMHWESVLYPLKMAASLKGLEADTAQVDFSDPFALCEPAASYEAAHSKAASAYVSGLVIFSFCWLAWEAARDFSKVGQTLTRGKGDRREALSSLTGGMSEHLPGLRVVLEDAIRLCNQAGDFAAELAKLELLATGPAQRGADLARRFRHYVFHGDDQVPMPDDWDDAGTFAAKDMPAGILRLYAMSRLVLMLTQISLIGEVSDLSASVHALGPFSEERAAGMQIRELHVVLEDEDGQGRLL